MPHKNDYDHLISSVLPPEPPAARVPAAGTRGA